VRVEVRDAHHFTETVLHLLTVHLVTPTDTVDGVLSRRVARRTVLTGVTCAALLLLIYLLAVWTRTGQRFEDAVLEAAHGGRQEAAVDTLHAITEWSLATAVVVVVGIGRLRGRLPLGLAGAGVIVASVLTTEIVRRAVPVRPLLLAVGVRREDQSFPSGHTTIAMSVMCGLVMVVPYRFRVVTVFLTSLWAASVGALTVTASWHRPSDTIGSDLIVLIYACAAIVLLARRGGVRRAEPRRGVGRTARSLLIGLLGAEAVVALCAGLIAGGLAMRELAAPADPEVVPGSALTAGRAIALAGGALVALTLLALLRHIDLQKQGSEPTAEVTRVADVVSRGDRPTAPTSPRTGRAH
jgi:membrane-associated phospholipid phosphatase